jgi:predicted dehydrogenase
MNVIHIGLGGRGRQWLGVVRDRPDMRSVSCVDPDTSALDWVRVHFPDQRDACYAQLDEALRHVKADAAIIATPLALRAGLALQALEAGLTVMLEPPFAASLTEATQVMEVSRRAGQPVIVAQNGHDTHCETAVQRLVREGRIGTLTHVSCVDRRLSSAQGHSLMQADYVHVLDVGIHHFDSLRRMLGVNPVSLMARCSKAPWSLYRHGSTTEALLEMEHNIHVQYHGSLTSNRDEHMLWIEGDRGVLWTDRSRLWWRKRGWRFFLPTRARKISASNAPKHPRGGMTLWLNQLKAAVDERRPLDPSRDDTVWTLAMVEAVMLSDRTGMAVRIDDLLSDTGITLPTPAHNAPGGKS